MKQLVLPPKNRASSTSRYPDAPDARLTTTATDVPHPTVSQPLPLSPSPGTSHVDVIENRSHLTRFTEHNSPQTPLLNRTSGNPTLYAMRGSMYQILAQHSITKSPLQAHILTDTRASFQARSLPSDDPPVITSYIGTSESTSFLDLSLLILQPLERHSQHQYQ